MFTERYMVDWLLQNSLGPMWLAMCKKQGWTPEVESDGTLQRLEERRIAWRAKRDAGEVALTDLMPLESFPPAPGQGAICIESRVGDARAQAMLAPIRDVPTGQALACERAFLRALDGSCRTPIAGHATIEGGRLVFKGLIITPDGTEAHEIGGEGAASDAEAIGRRAGEAVRATAGTRFFDGWT